MAYIGLLLRQSINCILLHNYWHYSRVLVSSISMQQVYVFFWYQSNSSRDCRDAYKWVLSGDFLGYKVSFGNATNHWYPSSYSWVVDLLLISMLICPYPAILRVSSSCRQYWSYKGLWKIVFLINYLGNSGAEVEHRFHRWKFDIDAIEGKIEGWALFSWHLLVNFANNKKFGYS